MSLTTKTRDVYNQYFSGYPSDDQILRDFIVFFSSIHLLQYINYTVRVIDSIQFWVKTKVTEFYCTSP